MITIDIFGVILSLDKNVLIIAILLGLIAYLFAYKMRNPEAGLGMCFNAFFSFIGIVVMTFFLVVGACIAYVSIVNEQYIALAIPAVWFFICYVGLKRTLLVDFNINIGGNGASRLNINWDLYGPVLIFGIMGIGFAVATIFIFSIIGDTQNQPYGPFPVAIAGIIFLVVTIGLFVMLYNTITGKIKFIQTGSTSFTSVSETELLDEDSTEKEIEEAVKTDKKRTKSFFLVWIILAIMFLITFVYLFLVDKGIIPII